MINNGIVPTLLKLKFKEEHNAICYKYELRLDDILLVVMIYHSYIKLIIYKVDNWSIKKELLFDYIDKNEMFETINKKIRKYKINSL
jgi:hypothetical protein